MVIDWLAAGLNPGVATLFVQSHVPEHAELHLLLSMITPLGWLERVPSYKDQQAAAQGKGPRHLRLPRLSAAAERRHPALPPGLRAGGRGPGGARGDHARDRAALQPPLRPRAGLRGQGRARRQGAGRPQHHAVPPAAQAASRRTGDPRRWSGRATLVDGNTRITVGRPRAAARLPGGRQRQHPARAAGAADGDAQGAGARRPQDVQVLRQHHRPARRPGRASRASSRRCRPIRRACAAPIRATRTSARCSTCTSIYSDEATRAWARPAAAAPASAASNARSR